MYLVEELIREGEEELGMSAGIDSALDNRRVGKILALKAVLEVDFDFPEEETK